MAGPGAPRTLPPYHWSICDEDQPFSSIRSPSLLPRSSNGIYQMVKRRGDRAGVRVYPHRFRHHFSHTWLDRGGAEGDLMELNGWSSSQMLEWYGGSVRGARARRHYDLIMRD